MKVKDLIEILEFFDRDMDVFATEGNFLKPFNLVVYGEKELLEWLDMWDRDMVKPNSNNLVIVLED